MSVITNEADQEFLLYMVKSLVDNPEEVVVDRKVDEMGVLLTLSVHPEDMGKIIGRDGNTAKALRTLLRLFGAKKNERLNMKINEPHREGEDSDAQTEAPTEAPEPSTSVLDEDLDI